MKKLTALLISSVFVFSFVGVNIGMSSTVLAQGGKKSCPERAKKLQRGTRFKLDTGGSCPGDAPKETLEDTIARIVNIVTVIVGIIAVIMIIYGGFRYITSGGDAGNLTAAKNTLIYAIIGLVIVALAQIIVRFVLLQAGQ